jgi:hypothetical protein
LNLTEGLARLSSTSQRIRASPLVGDQDLIQARVMNHFMAVNGAANDFSYFHEGDFAITKCFHRNLIGRVQDGRHGSADFARSPGQFQSGKTILVRLLEV